jgi:hypothetical protein
VPTASGYACAFGDGSGANDVELVRLDAQARPVGAPLDVPNSSTVARFALAASGDELLLGFADPTSSVADAIQVAADGTLSSQLVLSGPGDTTYGAMAAASGKGSFAVSWSSVNGSILYRAALASGSLPGSPVALAAVGWDDDPNALAAVPDGFLLVAATGSSHATFESVHLGCP